MRYEPPPSVPALGPPPVAPRHEVTIPGGPVLFARWCCVGCEADTGDVLTDIDGRDMLFEQAMKHCRAKGHVVDFWRGTRHTMQPLATEVTG